jgi:hypothetical protein
MIQGLDLFLTIQWFLINHTYFYPVLLREKKESLLVEQASGSEPFGLVT